MIERFFTRTKRPRHGRRRPRAVLTLTMFGLGLIGLAALARPAPWLVWNASASAPIGLYRVRSEEHTSELQSLMRISYAVFCLKKKKRNHISKKSTAHTHSTPTTIKQTK